MAIVCITDPLAIVKCFLLCDWWLFAVKHLHINLFVRLVHQLILICLIKRFNNIIFIFVMVLMESIILARFSAHFLF